MIVDYAANVRDMLSVAKQIDVPGGTDGIYTIPVHHADADKLAKELEATLALAQPADKSAPATTPQKLLVDQRTNTLILAGTEATYQRVRALVERIDIAVETENGGTMHVYQLKHAVAEEVAKTLNDAIAGRMSSTQQGAGARPATPAPPPTPAPTGAATGLSLEGAAHVNFDKATNKLIVMSTGRDYFALKNIIQELDEPRRQIYIEALIMEVNLGNKLDLGSSFHTTVDGKNGSTIVGGVQTPDLKSTSLATLAGASGLVGGWLGPMLSATSILGQDVPSYGILFQALAESANTDILSAPSIIALDNEEAKYEVGTVIPYQKGTVPVSSSNPTSLVTTNIDHEPLTLTLNIKAHISDDEVMLEIKHEAKDLAKEDQKLGPSWTTRKIETRTVVKDQQTVVIGGLMQEKEVLSDSKVPLLGDIPVLGHLFKFTKKRKEKTTLLIMLTPYIIHDQLDLEKLKERHLRERDEFIRSRRSLEAMKLDPHVDYRTKRGLVEEINRSVIDIETETAERAEMMSAPQVPVGPVSPAPQGQ
jgi:general secretion pathway protein D